LAFETSEAEKIGTESLAAIAIDESMAMAGRPKKACNFTLLLKNG